MKFFNPKLVFLVFLSTALISVMGLFVSAQQCTTHEDCSSNTPFCTTELSDPGLIGPGACVECDTSSDCQDLCLGGGITQEWICDVDKFCSPSGTYCDDRGGGNYNTTALFGPYKACCATEFLGPGGNTGTCIDGGNSPTRRRTGTNSYGESIFTSTGSWKCVDSMPHAEVLGVFTDQNPTPTTQCNSGSSYKVRITVTDEDGFDIRAANSANVRFCISPDGQIDYDSCYDGIKDTITADTSPIDNAFTCLLFSDPRFCVCDDPPPVNLNKCLEMTCNTSRTFTASSGEIYAHVRSNDYVPEPSVTIPSPNPDGHSYDDFCRKYVRDCTPEGGGCGWDSDCCISDDLRCRDTSPHHKSCVVSTCGWYLEGCDPSQENPCCGSLKCRETSGHGHHTCVLDDCAWYTESCQSTSECCGSMRCDENSICVSCIRENQDCTGPDQCCAGLECINDQCGVPPGPGTTTCNNKPDLVIGEITEAPDTVQAGSSDFFHVKASLRNAGLDLPQGASFKGQVWIVGGSPNIERSLGEITYAGHVPDELSFFVRMPSDIPTGSYQFKVSVDADSDIDECDEDNNEASKPVTVEKPDLVVDSITVAPGSVPSESCGYFRIKADIRNEGADLPQGASFKGQVWIVGGSPRIERSLREITYSGYTGTLPELSFLVQIPDDIPTGSYQFKVSVDADNDVDESNEANNDAFRAVTVVAAPDIIIESITPPDPVLIGSGKTLTARIRNQGSLATGDFKAELYVLGNSHRLSLGTITGLGPGESRTETINVIPPLSEGFVSCDLYRFRLEVDTEDVIDESCEHNNAVISSPVTFIKNKPDLVVDFLTPPNPVLIGSDQTLTARIRNDGGPFTPVMVISELTLSGLGSSEIIGRYSTDLSSDGCDSLGWNAAMTFNVLEAWNFVPGYPYNFILEVDTEDVIDEVGEDLNNVLTSPPVTLLRGCSGEGQSCGGLNLECCSGLACEFFMCVGAKPDIEVVEVTLGQLIILDTGAPRTPTGVLVGDSPWVADQDISVTVANRGNVDVDSFNLMLYVEDSSRIRTDILPVAFPALAAGEQRTRDLKFKVPTRLLVKNRLLYGYQYPSGGTHDEWYQQNPYRFGAEADPDNEISETDESNNDRTTPDVVCSGVPSAFIRDRKQGFEICVDSTTCNHLLKSSCKTSSECCPGLVCIGEECESDPDRRHTVDSTWDCLSPNLDQHSDHGDYQQCRAAEDCCQYSIATPNWEYYGCNERGVCECVEINGNCPS